MPDPIKFYLYPAEDGKFKLAVDTKLVSKLDEDVQGLFTVHLGLVTDVPTKTTTHLGTEDRTELECYQLIKQVMGDEPFQLFSVQHNKAATGHAPYEYSPTKFQESVVEAYENALGGVTTPAVEDEAVAPPPVEPAAALTHAEMIESNDTGDIISVKDGASINVIEVTDIEGRQKFLTNIFQNGIETGLKLIGKDGNQLAWTPELKLTGDERIEIPDGTILVFNGDLFDHGPDDLKLAEIFANTTKHYAGTQPEKFQIIIGNRDSNKLRMQWELNEKSIEARILYNDTATWEPDRNKLTFAEHLIELMLNPSAGEDLKITFSDDDFVSDIIAKLETATPGIKTMREADRVTPIKEFFKKLSSEDPKFRENLFKLAKDGMEVNGASETEIIEEDKAKALELVYLKWMLKNTMGCGADPAFGGSTFQFRRRELAAQKGVEEAKVSQFDVLDHFKQSIASADGAYRQVLDQGKIALRVGDTLYIHGGLTEKSTSVDGVDFAEEGKGGLNAWIEAINTHFRKARDEVIGEGADIDYSLPAATNDAIREGVPGGNAKLAESKILERNDITEEQRVALIAKDGTSSTIAQFFAQDPADKRQVPQVPDKIIKFLKDTGIKRVILGHQPVGNSPIGAAFVIQGIEFAYTDITRADLQDQATCVSKVTMRNNGGVLASGAETSVFVPSLDKVVTIIGVEQVIKFKADADLDGVVKGAVHTMVHTKDGGVIFLARTDNTNFSKVTLKHFSADELKTEAKAILDAMENPPEHVREFLSRFKTDEEELPRERSDALREHGGDEEDDDDDEEDVHDFLEEDELIVDAEQLSGKTSRAIKFHNFTKFKADESTFDQASVARVVAAIKTSTEIAGMKTVVTEDVKSFNLQIQSSDGAKQYSEYSHEAGTASIKHKTKTGIPDKDLIEQARANAMALIAAFDTRPGAPPIKLNISSTGSVDNAVKYAQALATFLALNGATYTFNVVGPNPALLQGKLNAMPVVNLAAASIKDYGPAALLQSKEKVEDYINLLKGTTITGDATVETIAMGFYLKIAENLLFVDKVNPVVATPEAKERMDRLAAALVDVVDRINSAFPANAEIKAKCQQLAEIMEQVGGLEPATEAKRLKLRS